MSTTSISPEAPRRIPLVRGSDARLLLGSTSIGAIAAIALLPAIAPFAVLAPVAAAMATLVRVRRPMKETRTPGSISVGRIVDKSRSKSVAFPRPSGGGRLSFDRRILARGVAGYGTTGSGKSEMLLSLSRDTMEQGGGVVFVDGKGDVAMFAKFFAHASACGREDDVFVLNFMPVDRTMGSMPGNLLSNTYDPFAGMGDAAVARMIVDMMWSGGDGSGAPPVDRTSTGDREGDTIAAAPPKERAFLVLTAVVAALRSLAAKGLVTMNVGTIKDTLRLTRLIDLAYQEQYDGFLGEENRNVLRSYLRSIPGYDVERGYRQSQSVLDDHGALDLAVAYALGSFVDVYGHVLSSSTPDVSMSDVVRGRRLLFVMLPALEKSNEEVRKLVELVLAPMEDVLRRDADEGRGSDGSRPLIYVDDEAVGDRNRLFRMSRTYEGSGFGVVSMRQDHRDRRDDLHHGTEGPDGIGAFVMMRIEDETTAGMMSGVPSTSVRRQEAGECIVRTERGTFHVEADYRSLSRDLEMSLTLGAPILVPVPEGVDL